MNRPAQFTDSIPATREHELRVLEPTLEQRLRFIDLCIECSAEAKALYPSPDGLCFGDETPRSNPHFAPAYNFLRVQRMRREGLPLSLLGDGKTASQRHADRMAETYGRDWNRALAMTPVRGEAA